MKKKLFKNSSFIFFLFIIILFVIINLVPLLLAKTNKNDVKLIGPSQITFGNTFPISDETGKIIDASNLKKNLLGEEAFTIVGTGDKNRKVNYEIYLIKEDSSKIKEDYIKVYLTNNDKERTPFKYYAGAEVPVYRDLKVADVDPNGRIIYSGTIKGGEDKQFLLRMWVSESYSLLEDSDDSFTVDIKVKKVS